MLYRLVAWIFKPNKYNIPHQGFHEKARRLKQIAAGTLKRTER